MPSYGETVTAAVELPDDAPGIKSNIITLLTVQDGQIRWANRVGTKELLVADCPGPYWVVWTGKYRSDVFSVDTDFVRNEMRVY